MAKPLGLRGRPGGWARVVGLLWRPLRLLTGELAAVREELQGTRVLLERLVAAQEAQTAHLTGQIWPRPAALPDGEAAPIVDVTYTSDEEQGELEQIGERLARATGRPPTEDEIVAEFDRMHLQ